MFNSTVGDALVNAPGKGVSNGTAFVLEIIATLLFVVVIHAVATDKRAPWQGVFAPAAIGTFIFTAATVVGPISGGSFNPARSLAPAIIAGEFGDVWIYIFAPVDRRRGGRSPVRLRSVSGSAFRRSRVWPTRIGGRLPRSASPSSGPGRRAHCLDHCSCVH